MAVALQPLHIGTSTELFRSYYSRFFSLAPSPSHAHDVG